MSERERALLALNDMERNAAYSGAAIARQTRRGGAAAVGAAGAGTGAGSIAAGAGPSGAAAFRAGGGARSAAGAVGFANGDGIGAASGARSAAGAGSAASDGVADNAGFAAGAGDGGGAYAGSGFGPGEEGAGSGDRAALVRELVYGVTKWKLAVDHVIFAYSKLRRERVALPILNILRLGVYQLVFLDRIPPSAACNESVKLAKKYGNKGSAAFVNALLRRVSADSAARAPDMAPGPAPESPPPAQPAQPALVRPMPPAQPAPPAAQEAAAPPAWPAPGVQPAPAFAPERAARPMQPMQPAKPLSLTPAFSFWLPEPAPAGDAERLSLMHSYPLWLCERWVARYGADFADGLMRAGNARPELTVRANRLRAAREGLIEALNRDGFCAAPGKYSRDAVRLLSPSGFARSPLFLDGLFTVQDESSMLCALAVGARPGDRVLDMCAAPGGKCGYLAELAAGEADILACDIYEHRIGLMEQNFRRLGHESIKVALLDAERREPDLEGGMDKVLLDAPCSGFGLIRKKPEIKWARSERDVAAMARAQSAMLENAAAYVKAGGDIVYSVCTTEPDEGEAVIEDFLGKHGGFRSVPICLEQLCGGPAAPNAASDGGAGAGAVPSAGEAGEAGNGESTGRVCGAKAGNGAGVGDAGTAGARVCSGAGASGLGLRLFPHTHGVDGFFIAKLRRER